MGSFRAGAVSAVRTVAQLYALPTAGARPLPSFLIIGAERAGTTSLYRYLVQHPQVMSATLHRKGAYYFATNFDKGVRWYRAHFPTELAMRARARRAGVERVVTGEACPYYIFHPLVPERVHALLPDARLILMLRDPVSRAYSHYQQEIVRGFEHLSFEEAIEAEPKRLAGQEERMRRDPGYYSFSHQHHAYLARGRYLEQIQRWHASFAPDRLLVIDSAAFFADPDDGFSEVLRFLELSEASLTVYPQLNARSYGQIDPKTRERLRDHFMEPNRRLEEYLGRSFSWGT
jgi:hypothetical protein